MVDNSSRKPLPQSLNGRFAHDSARSNSARSSRHMPSDDGQILRNLRSHSMTAADLRRIALSLERVEEYSHAGLTAFRVGSRIRTAWRLRFEKTEKTSRKNPHVAERSRVTDKQRRK